MDETSRDNAETRFATALVERTDGDIAGKVAAKGGEFVVHPEIEFSAMAPKGKCADDKHRVTETRK